MSNKYREITLMTTGFVEPRREDHGHGHGHAGLRPVRARPQARRQRSHQNQVISYCHLIYKECGQMKQWTGLQNKILLRLRL